MDSKERLIVLLRYLKDNTDEEKEVSAADIRRMFGDIGESITAPTLRDDIASLQRAKEDIVVREVSGKGTFFKYLGREWSEAELQILIDAISAGQFISRNKSDRLIDKIRMLAGPSLRESLRPCILTDNQVKAPNESTLYTVQTIKTAMDRNKRIRFKHYEYTQDMKSQPKHDGYIYEVSPYAMIWKKGRYYLVGWSEKHGDIARFRIDRMEVPKISAKERRPAPEELRLEDHSDRIFSMFDGPEETVTLRLEPFLVNQFADQFGENVTLKKKRDFLEVTVKVHLSPTFYAWVFQYGKDMTISAPEHVREAYAGYLQEAIDEVLGE